MSRRKVEAYKEYKKNKETIIKKQKRNRIVEIILVTLVAALFFGWVGYSAYRSSVRAREAEVTETVVDFSPYSDYLETLNLDFS